MPLKDNDTTEFFTSLEAGVLEKQIGHFITQITASALEHNKKGNININFDFVRENDEQVKIAHKVKTKRPTRRGASSEEFSGSTVMHFHTTGIVSISPEDKSQDMFPAGQVSPIKQDR